jgi:hypothetical protein
VWLQLPDELDQAFALINQRLTEQANKRLAEQAAAAELSALFNFQH